MTEFAGTTLIRATRAFSQAAGKLRFGASAAYVYNPLEYAWASHRQYLETYAQSPKKVIFLGMNPGPWGMAQTGVPFGEIASVRDWIGISAPVNKPSRMHAKRPVDGFACGRSEVSGRRLWGLFARRYTTARAFFRTHFVANYCPLLLLEQSGKNITPDKLPAAQRKQLSRICNAYLVQTAKLLKPAWVVGVGAFAFRQACEALCDTNIRIGQILHPSPASPAANKDWAGKATTQLRDLSIWK